MSLFEAVCIALAEVVKEVIYLRSLKQLITPNEDIVPIKTFEAKETKYTTNLMSSKRTRHIDV